MAAGINLADLVDPKAYHARQNATVLIAGAQENVRAVEEKNAATEYKHVDIDGFISVLYSLLEREGYLASGGKSESVSSDGQLSVPFEYSNKFMLTESYPDLSKAALPNDMVTVEISKRQRSSNSSNAKPFSEQRVQYRPKPISQKEDPSDGEVVDVYMQPYDNLLQFTCWQTSARRARSLASLLEKLMQVKYYDYLQQYIHTICEDGRTRTIHSDEYGASRIIGVPVNFYIRTHEFYEVKRQQINTINVFENK